MTDPTDDRSAIRGHWHRFLEDYEPLRPQLYRYCRWLASSPWDAEDLVQDTLARAFVTLACVHTEIRDPRAWLFRVATNQWLNRTRRAREVLGDPPEAIADEEPRAAREAAGTLVARLSPQERAAVVLKDVFDFQLEEIAETLTTTVGAIKAALHRGRGKLVAPEPEHVRTPIPAVLDEFCAAFNARDLERLTAVLLDDATNEFPGLHIEYGAAVAKRGALAGVVYGDPASDHSGIAPAYREGLLSTPARAELRVHRGEVILLAWFAHADGEAVRGISRFECAGDRIARMVTYFHNPEVVAEICGELGVPARSNGYRSWW